MLLDNADDSPVLAIDFGLAVFFDPKVQLGVLMPSSCPCDLTADMLKCHQHSYLQSEGTMHPQALHVAMRQDNVAGS